MSICSAYNCKNIGTLFDGSTVGLIACKHHEEKWRKEMIDLGVACINDSLKHESMKTKCANCQCNGDYFLNGNVYCVDHAPVGSVCVFVSEFDDDVNKIGIYCCRNGHRFIRSNYKTDCWCGEMEKIELYSVIINLYYFITK